jgi:hypothetical protein
MGYDLWPALNHKQLRKHTILILLGVLGRTEMILIVRESKTQRNAKIRGPKRDSNRVLSALAAVDSTRPFICFVTVIDNFRS